VVHRPGRHAALRWACPAGPLSLVDLAHREAEAVRLAACWATVVAGSARRYPNLCASASARANGYSRANGYFSWFRAPIHSGPAHVLVTRRITKIR